MFASVLSHICVGVEGHLVRVEVDIRPGIPGLDVVGLPDGAVREAKERVRVAIRNSGYTFPTRRIVINLAPAGIKKAGPGFDLPMALGILAASGQMKAVGLDKVLVLGELNLSGRVCAIAGVLSAIGTALEQGIKRFIIPEPNNGEAAVLAGRGILGAVTLVSAVQFLDSSSDQDWEALAPERGPQKELQQPEGDISDIKGQWVLKRALEISAAGRHNLFLCGPPGSGKTMAATRLPTLLRALNRSQALNVMRLYSIAGKLSAACPYIKYPPFRMPHHSASREGILGGGRLPRPGEVSLAHEGVLFLDEALEFSQDVLQSLREPIEQGRITLVRAEQNIWFPADFQLILATNACPCGNWGHREKICYCSTQEVRRYWKRLGAALLDRIDMRVRVSPATMEEITGPRGEDSQTVKTRVWAAWERQDQRFKGHEIAANARIPAGQIDYFCPLSSENARIISQAVAKLGLSARACHSILKIARTIADLDASTEIKREHLLEAISHRRLGENGLVPE